MLFALLAIWSAYSIAVSELKKKNLYLIYPLTVLYLLPSWIVDPRYIILPIALFLLFRREANAKVEVGILFFFILASLASYIGYQSGQLHF